MSDPAEQPSRVVYGAPDSPELESADDARRELERRGFVVEGDGARLWGRKETPDGVVTLTWSAIRWEPVWSASTEGGHVGEGWAATDAVDEWVWRGVGRLVAAMEGNPAMRGDDATAWSERSRRLRDAFGGGGR